MKIQPKTAAAAAAAAVAVIALFSSGILNKERGRIVDPSITGQAVTLSQQQIKNKAVNLYNTISGSASGLIGGLYNVLFDLNSLNDADFIAVVNQYATMYATSPAPTVYQLVNEEYTYPFTDTREEKTKVLQRLVKFGLA